MDGSIQERKIQSLWAHSTSLTSQALDKCGNHLIKTPLVNPLHLCVILWPGFIEWRYLLCNFLNLARRLKCAAGIYIEQRKNDAFVNVTVCRGTTTAARNRNEARLLSVDSNQSHFMPLLMLKQVLWSNRKWHTDNVIKALHINTGWKLVLDLESQEGIIMFQQYHLKMLRQAEVTFWTTEVH